MPENAVNTPNMPIVEDVDIVDNCGKEISSHVRKWENTDKMRIG